MVVLGKGVMISSGSEKILICVKVKVIFLQNFVRIQFISDNVANIIKLVALGKSFSQK